MNIFVLDKDPVQAARFLCDQHVNKMILESAQMLSTAVRLSGLDAGYKIAHQNHPCTIWARESLENWLWLRNHAEELNNERNLRWPDSDPHKSWELIQSLPEPVLTSKGLTPFAQAMPDEYKHKDAVQAYRAYYLGEKNSFSRTSRGKIITVPASWERSIWGTPSWWK